MQEEKGKEKKWEKFLLIMYSVGVLNLGFVNTNPCNNQLNPFSRSCWNTDIPHRHDLASVSGLSFSFFMNSWNFSKCVPKVEEVLRYRMEILAYASRNSWQTISHFFLLWLTECVALCIIIKINKYLPIMVTHITGYPVIKEPNPKKREITSTNKKHD